MQSKAKTIQEYLAEVPDERKEILSEMHKTIVKNMPKGFQEVMSYGMIGYVVPHSLYPAGYHCDPKQPLPFMCLASQKNYISFYHMGLYAGLLLEWFTSEWPKHSTKKLDMGKCCVRFKKPEDVPLKLIAELVTKVSPEEWIEVFENAFKKK
ncbi:MAG: DUF1801 domain-containing protein [Saprospiraceae bacterium]|nr:DUF1801 domain-containing protein [Saprospiraceae bacterium]